VRRRTAERVFRYAQQHFASRYTKMAIRFRGQFRYSDANTEPEPPGRNWPRSSEAPIMNVNLQACGRKQGHTSGKGEPAGACFLLKMRAGINPWQRVRVACRVIVRFP